MVSRLTLSGISHLSAPSSLPPPVPSHLPLCDFVFPGHMANFFPSSWMRGDGKPGQCLPECWVKWVHG